MPIRNSWGREVQCAREEQYSAKMLLINARNSLFIQPQSTETLYLHSGSLWFNLNGHEFELVAGASLTLERSDIAYFRVEEDSAVLEVSAGELARLVPLEDKQ